MYDKKLMWRAQLYVDESLLTDGTDSGLDDWNDLFPWTNAQGNAWDTTGTGSQIDLEAWTVPYDPDSDFFNNYLDLDDNPIRKVCNAVPYSWGCMDSPDDMNIDLSQQKLSLNVSNAGGWDFTLAPGDEWRNYEDELQAENGTTYYPFRPVLSSIMNHAGDFYDYNTPYDDGPCTSRSTGVDCSGFIQRAASYTGNRYAIKDVRWDGAQEENRLLWGEYDSGVKIPIDVLPGHGTESFYDLSWQVYDVTAGTGSLDFVIPGDVITMNGHIVLVYEIDYRNNESRIPDDDTKQNFPRNIYLIEASSPDDNWQVILTRVLNSFLLVGVTWPVENNRHIEIRRLIID